LVSRLEL